MFSAKCGTAGDDAGSTQVCAGDILRSRYTVANYSTEEADVTARLWLSTDDRWDSSDRLSPTRYEINVNEAASETHAGSWELPSFAFAEGVYHPIVRRPRHHRQRPLGRGLDAAARHRRVRLQQLRHRTPGGRRDRRRTAPGA